MFDRIIDWAVSNVLLVIIALMAVVAAATIAIPKLNLDAFPDVTNVQVVVNTEAPGMAAEEVEKLITFPVESVMYALPGVQQIRSISKTGLSGVTIVFDDDVDIYFARQLVFERLQEVKNTLPLGIAVPEMGPNTSGLGQVYQYLLLAEKGSDFDIVELRSLNDWIVKMLLMPVEGVTNVLSFGGEVKQYRININPNNMLSFGLSFQDVADAVAANNQNSGGWYFQRGSEQFVIRGLGWLDSDDKGLAQIRQIPLKTVDGNVVRVSDVATVKIEGELRQGAVTMTRRDENAEVEALGEVVSGIVLKRMQANTKATIDGIKNRLELIRQALPEGVTLQVFYDQSDLIDKAITTVSQALLLAFVFIVIVLLLFLLDLSATVLVLISIPVSIAIALSLMSGFGLSANLMSLGGLAVAIGMLVDGSVVMVDNIYRHLNDGHSEDQFSRSTMTTSHSTLIKQAAKEVARPIFFATAIILVVFSPLFSFEGVEAKLFQPMAVSIMLAIVVSALCALVVIPSLAALLFRRPFKRKNNNVLIALESIYAKSLNKVMKKPAWVAILAGILVLATASIVSELGTEFVPELEEGTINLRVTLAPSANLDTALRVAPKLEKLLLEFPEVDYALSRIGRPELGGDPEPVNNIEIYIGLKPIDEWSSAKNRAQLQRLMADKLSQHPGLLFNFSQPIASRVDELLSGVKAQLAIKLFGPDLSVLSAKGREIEQKIKRVDGASGVAMEQIDGEAQLVIRPNRDVLSRYGLSVADIMTLVSDGLGGLSVGQIIQGNERYDIYMQLDDAFQEDIETLKNLHLVAASGARVKLEQVASVSFESGPPQIRRDDVQRRLVIQANVQDRDMGAVVADIREIIANDVDLPAGYSVEIGGQFESQQRAQNRLKLVLPISLMLIALLLYFAFSAPGQVVLIMLNVPLAIIGGVWALYLGGQYLSVPSSIGFITLFGIAVLNGVVMVESINQRRAENPDQDMHRLVLDGAVSRLRPVLMTAITSALGLIPMMLSSGVGAEIQRPLATVIVGGLITATVLTLFVLPTFYGFFSRPQKLKLKEVESSVMECKP